MNPEFLINTFKPYVAYGIETQEKDDQALTAKTKKVLLIAAGAGILGLITGIAYAKTNKAGYAIGGFIAGAAIGAITGKVVISTK